MLLANENSLSVISLSTGLQPTAMSDDAIGWLMPNNLKAQSVIRNILPAVILLTGLQLIAATVILATELRLTAGTIILVTVLQLTAASAMDEMADTRNHR